MTIKKLVAGAKGAAGNSTGADIADAVNGLTGNAVISSLGSSSFKALFTKNYYVNDYATTDIGGCITGTYERSPDGSVVLVSRPRRNFITNPVFSGAVVGLKGAGGVLPTGWDLSRPETGWEIVSINNGRLRIRLFRSGGPAFASCSLRFSHTVGSILRSGLAWYTRAGVVSQSGAVKLLRLLFANSTKATQITQLPITQLAEYGGYLACTQSDSISCRVDVEMNDGTSPFDITFDVFMPMLEDVNSLADKTFYTPSQTIVGTSASIVDSDFANTTNIINVGNDVIFQESTLIPNPTSGSIEIKNIFKIPIELSSQQELDLKNYILNDVFF